mmetsp:Transcript_9062/g.25537  ORF Transcript_9062/g.25537 Transcript_9062/m.25537 type:complete len:760 (+) Transcript_9062:112-2391(+)
MPTLNQPPNVVQNRQRRRSLQNPLGNPTSATSSGERRGSSRLLADAVSEAEAEEAGRRRSSKIIVSMKSHESGSDTDDGGWDQGTPGAGVGATPTVPDRLSFSEKPAESERAMQATGDRKFPSSNPPELRRIRSDPPQPVQYVDVETCDNLVVGLNDEEGQGISEKMESDEAIRRHSSGGDLCALGIVSRRHSDEMDWPSANRPSANRPSMIRKTSLEHARPAAFGRPQNRKTSMGSYGTNDDMDPDAVDNAIAYWMPPPPSTIHKTPAGGELLLEADEDKPLRVDFRCACFKLTNISTVDFTSVIKFVLVFEWNDPRLCGLPITTNDLPGDLWGPDIILENAQNECEVVYDSFSLLSSDTGRLKRTITFHGPVYNPMNLRDFPFDNDELEMKFITICNWRTLDGSRFGNDPVKRVYTLEPMLNRKDVPFFFFGWGGKVSEFSILGWSQHVFNPSANDPEKAITFKFDIHLVRKAQYYYLKILLPLWLLVLTSLSPYGIETDDLQGRLEVLVTLLLSTIAFLYIVQESIPKMSHLTVIDKVVIASLVSLVLAVLFSFIISISPIPETLNWVLAIVNQVLYWAANIVLVGPPHRRYKQYIADMEARQARKELTTSGHLKPGMVLMGKRNPSGGKAKLRRTESEKKRGKINRAKSYSISGQQTLSLQGDHEQKSNRMLGFAHRFSASKNMDIPKHQQESLARMARDLSSQNIGRLDDSEDERSSDGGNTSNRDEKVANQKGSSSLRSPVVSFSSNKKIIDE